MRLCRSSGWHRVRALVAGSLAAGLAAIPGRATGQERPTGPFPGPTALADQLGARSSECCLMLLYPIGARRASMSEAVTSVSSPDAVFYNPAGLADLERNHFVLHHVESTTQQVDAFTALFTPGDLATFGISYELVDFGDQDIGQGPVPTGRLTYREHIVIASFATTLGSGIAAGLNYKYFNTRLGCSGQCEDVPHQNAVTHGLDFGVQYRPMWLPVQIGATLLNVGFPLQVENAEQADPMPTRLRVGIAYDVLSPVETHGPYALWLLVDAEEDDWKQPTSPETSIAMELAVGNTIFLRGGYGGGEGVSSGPAVGVGIIYSRFNVAVAKRVSSGALGDQPFQLTIDVGF